MNFISRLFGRGTDDKQKAIGMEDYMALVRVYFQATLASRLGITNLAMLPDLRTFKSTLHVPTVNNKLGVGKKSRCKKMLKELYNQNDIFFDEIDASVKKNCKKLQDVQPYLYQFQAFNQDLMMLLGNLMKFKLRVPGFFKKALYALGESPIPNYLKRKACAWSYDNDGNVIPVPMSQKGKDDFCDEDCFQTIFAANEGAVTAPTAGLHFSRELMKRMEIKGVDRAFITMHCGLGNFREIDVEDLTKHKMESEEMYVTEECTRIVNQAKLGGHKICAIGNTVNRALETVVGTDHLIKPFEGWTNKFIFPPYDFSVADSMVSNLQLPESIQLMLTCAYGGYEKIMAAYNLAVKEGYRFGCYGDAMLITD